MLSALPVFYFDKNNGLFIFHDQVNFAEAAGKIPLQQLETMVAQKRFSGFLPPCSRLPVIQRLSGH